MTIYKDGRTLTVTRGAFYNYYSNLGYEALDGSRSGENLDRVNTYSHEKTSAGTHSQAVEDVSKDRAIELSEIPLSEMSMSQMLEYAEDLGIDFDASITKKELRRLIRQHI